MTEEIRKKPIPKNSLAEKELDKAERQFDEFERQVKELNFDHLNQAPKLETEPQTKIAQADIAKSKDIYIKPSRSIGSTEKFNEKWREQYLFAKEYVYFTAENNEMKGETIEMWTKPFPGCPAEFWQIPVNKPIWAPRYVAEQLKRASYHTLVMTNRNIGESTEGVYYGHMAAEKTVQRLDALPATKQRSIFMGSNTF